MWFVAHQMAAVGRDISLSRAVVAVFLMGICCAGSELLTRPLVGDWHYLADFIVGILVAKWVLQLTFWRSLLAVTVYSIVMIGATVVISRAFHA
jgi:uncharacterized membrane protein